MFIVFSIISGVGQGIIGNIFAEGTVQKNLFKQLFNLLVGNIIFAGFYFSLVKMVRGDKVKFGELFSGFKFYLPLVLAYILCLIAILIGLVLLIVPGIILSLGLSMYLYLIMDRGEGAVSSLKKSWAMMKGYKGKMFVFSLLMVGVNILGALALLVGLFVSLPVSFCAFASFYNRMLVLNPPPADAM